MPEALIARFTQMGIDATTVHEENLKGASGSKLSSKCNKENRILVTLAVDFADIIHYPPSQYPGFMVIRRPKQAINSLNNLIQQFMPYLMQETLENQLRILEPTKYRIYSE